MLLSLANDSQTKCPMTLLPHGKILSYDDRYFLHQFSGEEVKVQ